jgi:hypothetical protein
MLSLVLVVLVGLLGLGGYVGELVTEWFFNRDV